MNNIKPLVHYQKAEKTKELLKILESGGSGLLHPGRGEVSHMVNSIAALLLDSMWQIRSLIKVVNKLEERLIKLETPE